MARTAYNQPRAKRSSNRKAVSAKRTFTAPRVKSAASRVGGSYPQGMLIHRGIGLPDRFRTKLQFSESVVLTPFSIIATQVYGVRMNGPYDPVLAIGGGQPTFYDTFAALYGRYNVVGAKLTATYALPLTTTVGDGPYMVGITGTKDANVPSSDAPTLSTTPNTTHSVLMTGGNTKTLTTTYSQKQISPSPDGTGDDLGSSAVNTVPNQPWNAFLWASPQGTSVAGSVNVIFTVEYIVDFYQLASTVDL